MVAKQLEALKQSGMSPQQARKTLQTWAEMGAKDEKELRALLARRSLKSARTLGAQMLLDMLCSAGAFGVGSALGQSGATGAIALQIVAYFGGGNILPSAALRAIRVLGVGECAAAPEGSGGRGSSIAALPLGKNGTHCVLSTQQINL